MNKTILSLITIMCSLCLISCSKSGNKGNAGAGSESSSTYSEFFAKVMVPKMQLSHLLAANDEYLMGGWAYRRTNSGKSEPDSIIIYHFYCSFEFDANNNDFPNYGVPFKLRYATSDEGSYVSVGFAKSDSMAVYKPFEAYFSEPESRDEMRVMNPMFIDDNDGVAYGLRYFPILDNTLILKTGINNWNHIVATLSEAGDEEVFPSEKGDEVILDLYGRNIYDRILAETPKLRYEANNGLTVELQFFCPPKKLLPEIKAIVMGTVYKGESNRNFMTPINSDGEFIVDGTYDGFRFEDSYLGVVKWDKDKLIVNDKDNKYEMHLKEDRK